MIARFWRGYTKHNNASEYQNFLLKTFLPRLHRLNGYKKSYVLRNDKAHDVEFVVITLWESFEAIKEFAGPNLHTPVIAPEAEKLLTRFDEQAKHYNVWEST